MKKTFYFLFTKSIGSYINLMSFVFPRKATQIAHGYFSEPRKGKFTIDTLPQTLKEAQLETIQHNEDAIQTYIWKGNNTIILLIHGWESNSSRWKKMLPYLKKSGSTIIAIDGPAQGMSSGIEFTVTKYAEFIDIAAKKYQPNYIIGHSMGGQTCLYYQYKYQNPNVQKIVVLGAPSDFSIILKNFTNLLSLNNTITKALINKYTQYLNQHLDQFSSKEFVTKIDVKGLIAHDIEDMVVLFDEGEKIAESWKDVQFIATKGLGHKLHDDDLYRKVYAFLFETE
ncbi:alpha/beta hydrolase [Flavobacterium franklandianum]|uniref:Alpha/beta hydrolase n=1 Tax=Flavobacterium franklandianum TaxID=2594430 RepID=A0A553C6W3_9FLAO|nr:alpha/beta hydrolase [Flavobacterium franklandianum]TRX16267.1 alpha/beta hydrolase [Flavobacterium franklandianum]TRX25090.1 alpha/beta hydrolase [Flavobacterium franklandianum]